MRKSLIRVLAVAVVVCNQFVARGARAEGASAAPAGAEASGMTLQGKILERIDAAPYSYLKLSTGSGDVWAAVPQTVAATGREVTVVQAFPMKDFESKSLKRTFELVYFGTLADAGAAALAPSAAHGGAGAMPPGHPAMGDGSGMAGQHQAAAAGPSDVTDVKVAKASGPDARTVAEVYEGRSKLDEKTVAIHGKVVKFNAGIMGRNWIHLRDGSGGQEKRDNDITVTTQDTVAVGDVVTATGTVRLDKDFGAGYAYPVIVEEAKISK